MKQRSSIVWRFFDRLEENNRCVRVLCKLCDMNYKFYGNTTNMRSHLTNKHPLQWELAQNGTLDESTLQYGEENETISSSKRKQKDNKNIEVYEIANYDSDEQHEANEAGINLVRQMQGIQPTEEEWLEEETYTVEPNHKRRKMPYKKIKRELESPPRRLSFKASTYTPKHYEQPERLILQETQRKDEYSVFGEYVANKLRKVKLPKTRGNLQQLITTVLWQAEYGMYDSADAVKQVLSYSVNDNAEKHNQQQAVVIEEEPNQSTELEEDFVVTNES